MRNILDGLAATAVIVALGAAPSPPSPFHLVGRWVRDANGRVVGSIWAIKSDDAVMLVGAMEGSGPGNPLVNVPLSEIRQTADGLILGSAGLASLGLVGPAVNIVATLSPRSPV